MEDPAVSNFREYIRIRTVSAEPDPDYDGAVKFLERMAKDIELPFRCIEVHPGMPVVIISWEGTDPSLPSLMLNSHTDVVPVFLDQWKCDPFEAKKDENGDIYGRGTQDMKSVGIQYIEAIKRLKKQGVKLLRTIHMTFVPDEEVTGRLGMGKLVQRSEFKDLNVGYVLDEGLANPKDIFTVFYGERPIWWVNVKCVGNPGHGSRFIENTAAEKLQKVINSFLAFREEQKQLLQKNEELKLGDVTTVNMNKLEGGIAYNVVPMQFVASFDIRLAPTVDMKEFEEKIKTWCTEAGTDVTYEFLQKHTDNTMTSIDKSDPWWNAFTTACEQMSMKIETEIFPAATDSRYLRELGYSAIGFSPMNNTPILLHDHNEFLNENIYLKGITIYEKIIPALANVPAI
ncbi:aminoacylase-1-like [Glandiceps talaboti]